MVLRSPEEGLPVCGVYLVLLWTPLELCVLVNLNIEILSVKEKMSNVGMTTQYLFSSPMI